MKYFMCPVVNRYELEEKIKLQYDIKVNIADLFFSSYECETMEYLDITPEEDEFEGKDDFFGMQRKMIRGFLRDIMPEGTDSVIIDLDF